MKFILMLVSAVLVGGPVLASADVCSQWQREDYQSAIGAVAKQMSYSKTELCSLARLADIHVAKRSFLNADQMPEMHTWVTLHYSEESCQYFVRDSDQVITRSNCYNTF